jgi:hypothetical protein
MTSGNSLQPTRRRVAVAILALAVVMASPSALADSSGSSGYPTGDRVFDAMVLRPLGALGTVVGFAFFVCSVPLAGPTRQLDLAWDTFVLAPADYTFERDLGDF